MRVFVSHSSQDKPAVQVLAAGLRAPGIDAWLDSWEIALGDDIVARINQGLQQADAGIIVFSKHSRANRWVESEVSYLKWPGWLRVASVLLARRVRVLLRGPVSY